MPGPPDAGVPVPTVKSANGIASFSLIAALDPKTNLPTFVYQGKFNVVPTIRVRPGDTIAIDLTDDLPSGGTSDEVNLHFHGLSTSPRRPADDVLTMVARPGGSLHYVVPVPKTQPPGLYWYHPHVHGKTNYQVGESGISGAIVVEGIERHFPALAAMPEQLLIVRELGLGHGDAPPAPFHHAPHAACRPLPSGDVLTVNGEYRPALRVPAGKPAFFRVVNATGHRTLDLAIDAVRMQVVAFDGYPLDRPFWAAHVVLPPAGRVEFAAAAAVPATLRTRCYDSGPTGDDDPEETIATLKPKGGRASAGPIAPVVAPANRDVQAELPQPVRERRVRFTEDPAHFYINGRAYAMDAPPLFVVKTGTTERWTIENRTPEVHAFHLHQVHFIVESVDGRPSARRIWRDTVVVPASGSIVILADFRSPLIRGTFLFHCHILDHEDHGMMAKIEAI